MELKFESIYLRCLGNRKSIKGWMVTVSMEVWEEQEQKVESI